MIPFDRIVALDDIGDKLNEGPHLIVEYRENGNPFDDHVVKFIRSDGSVNSKIVQPDKAKQIAYFDGNPPTKADDSVNLG